MALFRPSLFQRALLLLVSLFIGLAICEASLRVTGAVREVGPPFTRYDPVYGKRLRENLRASRTSPEFHVRYSVNSLGFRGPEPDQFPSRSVLFVGDSFTEGYGVTDGQEFPELIRRTLLSRHGQQAPPVVNAGIGNAGNGHWVKLLRREGRRFDPRLVVLQFTFNDFADNAREQMYRVDGNRQLVELPVQPRGPVHAVNDLVAETPGLGHLHVLGFGYQLYNRFNNWRWSNTRPIETSPAEDELTYRLWEEVLNLCRDEGWPVVALSVEITGGRMDRLGQMLSTYNAPHIIVPSKRDRPELYYAVDGHWNATGHAYVAQVLERELNGILSAQ
jgi:GDSL-like Lipase/Acylhydrolase family